MIIPALCYNSYKSHLIHQPNRQWEFEPVLIKYCKYTNNKPTYSIIIPVHNQELIISKILGKIIEYTLGSYELIIIIDGCLDLTKQEILNFFISNSVPCNCTALIIIENINGIFETSCDNQGFVSASGEYLIEIQADMLLLTLGYNVILATGLYNHSDLIAISGRCCHTLAGEFNGVGKLGELVQQPHQVLKNFDGFNKIYLSHTVNRGPLILKNSMVKELGYLDEKHFVLGNDEHDLFTRAWHFKKYRTGFVPIETYSPLEWGTTRKSRLPEQSTYLELRQLNQKNSFLSNNAVIYPTYEERELGPIHPSLLR